MMMFQTVGHLCISFHTLVVKHFVTSPDEPESAADVRSTSSPFSTNKVTNPNDISTSYDQEETAKGMTSTQKTKRYVSVSKENIKSHSVEEAKFAVGIGIIFISLLLIELFLILCLDGLTLRRHLNLARRNLGLTRKSKVHPELNWLF